ncbi:MAG: SPOR domain-containing protein [Nitrospinae bacterium]|nr:SPOR domain-containing protein [Nitrospinota bacterium]
METLIIKRSQQSTYVLCGFVFCFLFLSSSTLAEEISAGGWLVQLGSFQVKKNAENFVSRIKKKGYTPFLVQAKNSRWFKVRVGPYPSKNEARQVADDLKKNHAISALVVLSPKGPPDIADSVDSIDIVVSQMLIWLKAWESGEINTYLSFYSKDFKTPRKSRKQWEQGRRFVLGRNTGTTIQVSDMEMKQDGDVIEMSFIQDYKSDRVSDIGRKELIWKNEGNSWKIIKETWAPKK